MFIGAHISAAGSVANTPLNAKKQGCECYQFFSRPPQGGQAPLLSENEIGKFKNNNKKYGFNRYYIHAPYFINLASANNRIYHSSISVLKKELERGSLLGAKFLMTHLGSARDLGEAEALKKVIRGIEKVLTGYTGSTQFLIELSAGSGQIIGDSFKEISHIIKEIEKSKIINHQSKINVCFDTAHAFESGYDLRDGQAVKKTFAEFDKTTGLEKLKLIHLNDSKTALGSRSDRHADIGDGEIGLAGFSALIKFIKNKKLDIDLILETPTESRRKNDIQTLKSFRDKK